MFLFEDLYNLKDCKNNFTNFLKGAQVLRTSKLSCGNNYRKPLAHIYCIPIIKYNVIIYGLTWLKCVKKLASFCCIWITSCTSSIVSSSNVFIIHAERGLVFSGPIYPKSHRTNVSVRNEPQKISNFCLIP